uniref:ATP synthase subunit a n=1 Tax=Haplothrips aculeatus TaxID=450991 RepID=A0A0H3VPT5_9NEOP|nr:ATP synthase F0 subunit 6 [Haplothrips aculeatus]AKE35839.1 ATP synthase F0 subunit 6 [Haplothrips aculeatus]
MFFKMKMNLFSSFDLYSGNMFFFNILMLFLVFFFPCKYWYFNSRNMYLIWNMFFFLKKEFFLLIGKNLFGGNLIYIIFFMFILQYNIFGMFPYIFTMTSQLNMNLYFSLNFFLIFFLLGLFKLPNMMMVHLTPLGSPNILAPFLIIIELISMIIRPLTLSIRLTANIISGHILMEILLGPAESMLFIMKIFFYCFMLPIFFLELVVCFVQAFVISSLSSLYLGEPISH